MDQGFILAAVLYAASLLALWMCLREVRKSHERASKFVESNFVKVLDRALSSLDFALSAKERENEGDPAPPAKRPEVHDLAAPLSRNGVWVPDNNSDPIG